MLFLDDIVLVAESKHELNANLDTWKTSSENKGLRINTSKLDYLWFCFSKDKIVKG